MHSGGLNDDMVQSDQSAAGSPYDRTLTQALELWVFPEIETRKQRGEIDTPLDLWAFQVMFPAGGGNILVRLNQEIRGNATLEATREIQIGAPILRSDVDKIREFDLIPSELDYGHFTAFRQSGDTWFLVFNFLRGRALASAHIDRAEEFLKTGQLAFRAGMLGPAADNLFSAAELVAKAILIVHLNHAGRGKSHDGIKSAINNWRRLGNIASDFVDTYNRLANARAAARYLEQSGGSDIPENACDIVQREIGLFRERWRRLN
ncbi:MAG: HEPN domain-containing protein [Alphaproteobacteria bacterium]|nr:HEPN domain-containing protein [Alphaproteobacteria bacterium]